MKFVLPLVLSCMISHALFSQCEIVSSRGWTATVEVTPVEPVVYSTFCPWFYIYEVQFDYKITFSGSTSGRGLAVNVYMECTGGSGGEPFSYLGYFTENTEGTRTTFNFSRHYTASGGAFNYGNNPDCTEITISDINCHTVRLGYWGVGVSGSTECATMALPLPVELGDFSANKLSYGTLIEWTTLSEQNNDFFLVEKSYDAVEWNEIDRVEGAGTTSTESSYSTIDHHEDRTVYYRLTQVDYNGESETFSPIAVSPGQSGRSDLPYPNPSNTSLTIPDLNETDRVLLFNLSGQLVEEKLYERQGQKLYVGDLPNGIYFLQLSNLLRTEQHKILVRH